MQQYQKDFYKSRGADYSDFIACEYCDCKGIVDIHHIEQSFRWKRKHNKDWSDLIWLCRVCHEHVHANNNLETRAMLKEIVLSKLK